VSKENFDWADDFKKMLIKRLEELGHDVSFDNIQIIGVDIDDAMVDFNLSELDIPLLARLYSFSIMSENYEQAQEVKEELDKRGCEVKIHIDDETKQAMMEVIFKPIDGIQSIKTNITVTKNGMFWDNDDENRQ
jgi:hypothetical protein